MELEIARQKMLELRLTVLTELENAQQILNKGWQIDWSNPRQDKFYISFDKNIEPVICKRRHYSLAGGCFFMSEADAYIALTKVGRNIYHLYSTVDDNLIFANNRWYYKPHFGIIKSYANASIASNIVQIETIMRLLEESGYYITNETLFASLAKIAEEQKWTKQLGKDSFYYIVV